MCVEMTYAPACVPPSCVPACGSCVYLYKFDRIKPVLAQIGVRTHKRARARAPARIVTRTRVFVRAADLRPPKQRTARCLLRAACCCDRWFLLPVSRSPSLAVRLAVHPDDDGVVRHCLQQYVCRHRRWCLIEADTRNPRSQSCVLAVLMTD